MRMTCLIVFFKWVRDKQEGILTINNVLNFEYTLNEIQHNISPFAWIVVKELQLSKMKYNHR